MANGHPWFKDYQGDFLGGTNGMPPAEFAVYVRVIWMMYENNGSVAYNDKYLAAVCGLSLVSFRKAVEKLVQLQKLTVCNGELSNERAAKEICKRLGISKKRASAQSLSVEARKLKSNKTNDTDGATAIANGDAKRAQKTSKRIARLDAREKESPYRDLSFSNSEDSESKNAARIARVEVARSQRSETPENEESPSSRMTPELAAHIDAQIERDNQAMDVWRKKNPPVPTFEQFWAAYPLDSRSNEENCRKIWDSPALGDYDHRAAVEGIAILLAWVNEAPSDPEREIPTAEFWLSRRRGSAMMARFPHLNPNARTNHGEQPESENAA